MNDQAFSQTIFSRTGLEQFIQQVESFFQVYTEVVFVLLLAAAVTIAWMSVRELRREQTPRPAPGNAKPAAVKTRGLEISRDSIY